MSLPRRLAGIAGLLTLAAIEVVATPGSAEAWWRGGWCCGVGFGVFVPPVVVAPPVYAPPPVYYPPQAAYYPPPRPWIPPHWERGYWVPGHWG